MHRESSSLHTTLHGSPVAWDIKPVCSLWPTRSWVSKTCLPVLSCLSLLSSHVPAIQDSTFLMGNHPSSPALGTGLATCISVIGRETVT